METGQQWASPGQQPPAGGSAYNGAPYNGTSYGGLGQPFPGGPPPAGAKSWMQRNPRAVIGICAAVVGLIIAAIIGHAIASGSSIAVGDCVRTSPSVTSGWDIKKVDCNQQYGLGSSVYKVDTMLGGSGSSCFGSDETTFNDEPANKTYCLSDWLGPNE